MNVSPGYFLTSLLSALNEPLVTAAIFPLRYTSQPHAPLSSQSALSLLLLLDLSRDDVTLPSGGQRRNYRKFNLFSFYIYFSLFLLCLRHTTNMSDFTDRNHINLF